MELHGCVTHVPTGSGDLKSGLVHGILRQLGLTIRDLRYQIGGGMKPRAHAATDWPVDLIPAEEGGYIVNFPDLPNGWSQGETR